MQTLIWKIGFHPSHQPNHPTYFLEGVMGVGRQIIVTRPGDELPSSTFGVALLTIPNLPYFSRDQEEKLAEWFRTLNY